MRKSRSRMPPLAWGLAPIRRLPFGARSSNSGMESAISIEQLLGFVALHPAFKLVDMIGMVGIDQERHLVRPERSLDLQSINYLWVRSSPWVT